MHKIFSTFAQIWMMATLVMFLSEQDSVMEMGFFLLFSFSQDAKNGCGNGDIYVKDEMLLGGRFCMDH